VIERSCDDGLARIASARQDVAQPFRAACRVAFDRRAEALRHSGLNVAQPFRAAISGIPPPVGTLSIDRQPPRQPDQPRAEAIAVAQLTEVAMRLDERFLGDVFGILAMVQHAVGDAKRESGRFNQARFELPLEPFVHAHEAAGEAVRCAMHSVSGSQTPPPRGGFSAGRIIPWHV